MQISQYLRGLKYWEFLEINNLGFSTALEFQGIPNYAISRTQRVELLAIFLELEAKTASCGQGMTQSKSELNTANDGRYLSTFYQGLIQGVGSNESCLLFSKSHLPPSWITTERPDWKLVSRFRLGQQSPMLRRFYSSLSDQPSTISICDDFVVYFTL